MNVATLLVVLVPMAVAVLALALPLVVGRHSGDAAAESSVAILKDQLAELDRDVERGLIAPAEAKAARLEIQRRLLKAVAAGPAKRPETTRLGRALVALALIAVPVGATAFYLRLGDPTLPDRPLASRADERQGPEVPEQVRNMVAGLEARLAADPDDLEGWLMLGRSQLVLENPEAAIAAYREALARAPAAPEAVAGLAEALMARSMGVVTPEVRELMFELAERRPGDPRPPYYLGLADAQAGDTDAALERWRALLAASPADAPWRAQIEPSIRQAAGSLGIDPEPILALAAEPTPEEEAAQLLAELSPEERSARIREMVEGLAARLQAEGGSAGEWQRLGRSRLILGERAAAAEAFRQALALAPDDPTLNKDLATALMQPPSEPGGLAVVPDAALPHLEQALAQRPDDPEIHWYLGIRALAEGEPDATREHWEKVLTSLDPATPEYALVQSQLDRLSVN